MRLVKWFSACFLVILFSLFIHMVRAENQVWAANGNETRMVKVGLYDNKPKVYRDANGQAAGLFPDILNYIAKQENWQLEYVSGTWEECLTRLEKGEINIMVDVAITAERQKKYDFTNETVLSSWGVIFVNKNSDIAYFRDLDGKKVAILKLSVYRDGAAGFDQYMEAFGLKVDFVEADEYAEVFNMLNKGEVDAAIVSRVFALTNQKNYPNIKETDMFFNPTELRFALTKGKADNQYLTERLDYWMKTLKNGYEGVYRQALERHDLTGAIPSHEVVPPWVYAAGVSGVIVFGLLVVVIVRLIRRRTTAIQELRWSEEKFSKAFQTAPWAVTITQIENGKFIDVNNFFVEMTGFTREEALANSSIGMKLWANGKDRQQVLSDLQAGRDVVGREYQFRMKDGRILTGLFSAQTIRLGKKMCLLSSINDITELKRKERQVIEVNMRDEAILNSIGDAVFACDKQGKILLFNKMAEKMAGISAKDVIGKNYKQVIKFIKENTEEPCDDFVAEAIKTKKITEMLNHTLLLRKDGQKIPVADSAAPIEDFKGDVIGCVIVFHDVTKEREIENAKTELVSLASHQLRTPLTALRWISELLGSGNDGKLNKKQQQHADEINSATKRMIILVNAILNASRLELGTFKIEPKVVHIKKIVQACTNEMAKQLAEKKLTLEEKYDPKILTISADPKLLHMILENLFSNAIKYTPKGGRISLTIYKDKNMIVIKVADNGMGIPKSQQSKVFEKLFRADNAKKIDPDGTGLGLYIVQQIINKSGGKIWFESQEGKGSTFYAAFPLSGMVKKTGTKQLTYE